MAITSEYFCKKMFARMFCASGISGIALAISNVIDAVCVGSTVGEVGLAAIGIVSPIYILYNVIGYAFSMGGSITFSHLLSKGKEKKAVDHFNEMLIILIVISILLSVLGILFIDPFLTLLGAGQASDKLYSLSYDYAFILIAALPVFMLNFLFNDFLRCDNNQYRATLSFVVGTVVDFSLNILFVIVLGMKVRGAAYATVIAQTVSVIVALPHFFSRKTTLKFRLKRPHFKQCWKSLKTGFSTSIDSLFMFVFLLTANQLLMNNRSIDGELYVAVFDVVMNISYITGSMFLAAGETLRPLASTFYAEHNDTQARSAMKLSLKWGYIINSVIIGIIALFPNRFAALFGITTEEGILLAKYAIRIFCIGTFLSGISMIMASYYQSIEEEGKTAMITLLRTFLFLLPATVAICLFKVEFFWFAIPIAEALTVLIILIIMNRKHKKNCDDKFFSYMLCELDKMNEVLTQTEAFCEENNVNMKNTNMVLMFIEETCNAIINNAFTGGREEYIQITVAIEENGVFVLHVRDSAVSFNPFDMTTRRLSKGEEDEDDIVDSMGILMMKNKASDFYYRRYQGFNMLTIKF